MVTKRLLQRVSGLPEFRRGGELCKVMSPPDVREGVWVGTWSEPNFLPEEIDLPGGGVIEFLGCIKHLALPLLVEDDCSDEELVAAIIEAADKVVAALKAAREKRDKRIQETWERIEAARKAAEEEARRNPPPPPPPPKEEKFESEADKWGYGFGVTGHAAALRRQQADAEWRLNRSFEDQWKD